MKPRAYYNEFDPKAAAALRQLIRDGLIAPGEVDERSIKDIEPDDLRGFEQVHLFAGGGGWSIALRLAGWPDDAPVWTGSCPCQPFSAAGKRRGTSDERHLWPEMFRLVSECRPAVVFGEQVASKDGREWLARVFADLEGVGYAAAGADLCAAGVGAPHIRQRLWWVADAGHGESRARSWRGMEEAQRRQSIDDSPKRGGEGNFFGWLPNSGRTPGSAEHGSDAREWSNSEPLDGAVAAESGAGPAGMADSAFCGRSGRDGARCADGAKITDSSGLGNANDARPQKRSGERSIQLGARTAGPWEAFELASCRDGKSRRVAPGVPLLAHGIPGRVAQLRLIGNSIVPQVAAEFIAAYLEVTGSAAAS